MLARLLAGGLFAGLLMATATMAADKNEEVAVKKALQQVGEMVGEWKGNGKAKVGTREQLWKETISFGWKFKGGESWIAVEFKDGKNFTSGDLKYVLDKKLYRLTVTDVNKKELVFDGTIVKGNLVLTGQLGEVMRESAQAAYSYAKSRAKELDIPEDDFINYDLHIHIPEGAIPKDGPSAGITLATAIVSTLAQRPVRHNIAMTGEITLRGNVLPVGGIKEKVLAALRAQVSTIILPQPNQRDLSEVPEDLSKNVKFVFVEHVRQVFREALLENTPPRPPNKRSIAATSLPKQQLPLAVDN